METLLNALPWIVGGLILILLLAALRRPLEWLVRLAARTGVGLAALWALSGVGGLVGLHLGVNLVNALVLGVLGGTFALGTFTKVANAKGAYVAFFVAAVTMVCIKYMAPAGSVSIWSYSIISIAISLVVGIPVSMITRKLDGDTSKPVKDATIYHN